MQFITKSQLDKILAPLHSKIDTLQAEVDELYKNKSKQAEVAVREPGVSGPSSESGNKKPSIGDKLKEAVSGKGISKKK